jgi:hypothetical protein
LPGCVAPSNRHKHNLAVILGTRRRASAWLTAKYPTSSNKQGERLHRGRRFTCPTNQVYRRLSLIIASEMAGLCGNAGRDRLADRRIYPGLIAALLLQHCQADFKLASFK